jgi:hypothetical protein
MTAWNPEINETKNSFNPESQQNRLKYYNYLAQNPFSTPEEDEAWADAERRMDTIGQNGNTAEHYDEPPEREKYGAYHKDVRRLDSIDVYETHRLFAIDDPSGCLQHASKKLLLSGVRTGGKTKLQDIEEARDTLNRWLEMERRT